MVLRIALPNLQPRSLAGMLAAQFSPPAQATLRQFLFSVKPPVDACRIGDVIASANACLAAYCAELPQPTDGLTQVVETIAVLDAEASVIVAGPDWPPELENPLYRRLRQVPVWALLLDIRRGNANSEMRIAIGAELALSLAMRKPFTRSLAIHMRSTLEGPVAAGGGPHGCHE